MGSCGGGRVDARGHGGRGRGDHERGGRGLDDHEHGRVLHEHVLNDRGRHVRDRDHARHENDHDHGGRGRMLSFR